MLYFLLLLTTGAIVALDQWSKILTVAHIDLGESIPLWDGVLHLTYILNTGAAFSILAGQLWFFFIVTALFLVAVVFAIWKKWVTHPLGLFALAMVSGGAIGNLIDRINTGAVVDMIDLAFMNFAIFNLADCFIVVGAVLLCMWAIFFDQKKPKEEMNHDDSL